MVYDPKKISYEQLLKTFWENHDPTQGMRQGNDVGTQYRSGIYAFTPAQRKAAEASKAMYEQALEARRFDAITTEIVDAPEFYFAEDYHQQYLAKNPMGYCGLGGTGVSCPIGVAGAGLCAPRSLILSVQGRADYLGVEPTAPPPGMMTARNRRANRIWDSAAASATGARHAQDRAVHRDDHLPQPVDSGAVLSRAGAEPAAAALSLCRRARGTSSSRSRSRRNPT